MKKWAILIVVALAAALLIMQYAAEKKKVPVMPGGAPAPASGPAVGVALPADALKPVTSTMDSFVPQNGRGPIVLPLIQTSYKGACTGGSLKDMMDKHDVYWGSFAKDTPIPPADSLKMYDFMEDYVSCQAAARTDVSFCDSLPGPGEKDGIKVSLNSSPSFTCRKKTNILLFEAYLAGTIKGDSYCRQYLASFDQADLARFSVPEFCEVVSAGPENAASFLLKAFAPASPDGAAKLALDFPVKESDCKKNQECLTKFHLYSAIKKGRPDDCPAGYKAQCQALSGRSTAPCDKTLQDMSKFYCASIDKFKKTTGGFLGMSKEAIAENNRKSKEEKEYAEKMKKDQEKLQVEINARAKAVMKRGK